MVESVSKEVVILSKTNGDHAESKIPSQICSCVARGERCRYDQFLACANVVTRTNSESASSGRCDRGPFGQQ